MKKILLSITAMAAMIGATAQINPLDMFPNREGEVLINKSYTANDDLKGTMKYTIAHSRMSDQGADYLEIVFIITDRNNEVADYGTIYVDYNGEELNLRMSNRPETMNIENFLCFNTKLMNDFLDYPDIFASGDDMLTPSPFHFDPADYTIKIGEKNRDFVNVKIFGRDFAGREKITTPVGEFDAYKINFGLDIYNNDTKQTDKYHGTEWYAAGKGMVRTEIFNQNGLLVDYSELTETYRQ